MKNVVIVVLLLCPVFALAQSRGDILVIRDAWHSTTPKLSTKKEKQTKSSVKIALEKAVREKIVKSEAERKKRELEIKRRKEIIKAIFFGGKFPWESEEDYRVRTQNRASMQGQPFK